MSKRARLTRAEKQRMALAQSWRCGCGCKGELPSDLTGVVGEHITPFALSGTPKPDALYLKACADRKTFGLRGDVTNIAKAKRLRDGKTQADKRKVRGPSFFSRGFSKLFKRRMNGEIVPR